MLILITREHIDNGIALSSTCCPIALACKDAGLKGVWIDGKTVQYRIGDSQPLLFALPPQAVEFVYRFDMGGTVSVFSFDLPTPDTGGKI